MKIVSLKMYEEEYITPILAKLIAESFASKFTNKLFSQIDLHSLTMFMSHFIYHSQAEDMYFYEDEDQVMGCIFLPTSTYKFTSYYKTSREYLTIRQFTKLSFLLGLLVHKVKADELYIDFISVLPEYRGHGVGKKLLHFAKNVVGNRSLTLNVSQKNPKAIKLYLNEGFVFKKATSSGLSFLTVGIREWQFMEWSKIS